MIEPDPRAVPADRCAACHERLIDRKQLGVAIEALRRIGSDEARLALAHLRALEASRSEVAWTE